MKRGDIYLVDLEPTAGHEQRGHRPVVIISTERFNQLTSCPIILPITNGGGFARRLCFSVELFGTQATGIVRRDQPHSIDLHARNTRKVDVLPLSVLNEILAKVGAIFQ